MKHHTSLLAVLTALSLAACGGSGQSPDPADNDEAATAPAGQTETTENETARAEGRDPQGLFALLERVSMASDDSYEPEIRAEPGETLRLDGALTDGEWSERGALGISYGRSGFAPTASFRCDATGDDLVITVHAPRIASSDDAPTSDAITGSLITASGVATGAFTPSERSESIHEMRVPSLAPALADLAGSERLGVAVGTEDLRLMPMSPLLLTELASCASLAG
ncbi:hypothetical protein AWH62_15220 [Maricaulis sp. W15]|nr:hypothetical protein AWH62_15220 [Maricaulis sp. W15]